MIKDTRKGLDFTYNELNLLSTVKTGSTLKATYYYLADGTKSIVRDAAMNGFGYLGSLTYKNSSAGMQLEGSDFGEGRILKNGNSYEVKYFLRDHLGSVRVIVNAANGGVQERNDYYPFGSRVANSTFPISTNRHKYNGKEEQTTGDLKYLDYGARMYDANLGRWHSLDPLAKKYYSLSPYNYCANNPLKYIDPDGKRIVITIALKSGKEDFTLTRDGLISSSIQRMSFESLNGSSHPEQIIGGYKRMLDSGHDEYVKQVTTLIDSENVHVIDATERGRSGVQPGSGGETVGEAKAKAMRGEGVGTTTRYDFSGKFISEKDGIENSIYATIAHEIQHQYDYDQGLVKDAFDENGKTKKGDDNPAEKRAVENERKAREQEKMKERDRYSYK